VNDPCSPLTPHSELRHNELASEFTKFVLLVAFVGSIWQGVIKNSYFPPENLEMAELTAPFQPQALEIASNLAYTPPYSAHRLSCMHLRLLMEQAMIKPLGAKAKMLKI
jgi:hypothetical protein